MEAAPLGLAEPCIVPAKRLGLDPLGLSLLSCVLDDDAHSMGAVIVGEVAHHPHARMLHLDDCGDALGRPEPQHRHVCWGWHGIAVERDDPE